MRNQNILFKAVFSATAITFCAFLIGILSFTPTSINAAPQTVGDSIPGILCSNGMEATVYAEGLASPDGLAFDASGVLHVAEETSGGVADGKISQVSSTGIVTPIMTGLVRPEGIAFDASGNLYYVDDSIENGSVIKRSPGGITTTIASSDVITSPEGIAIGTDGTIYVTASDAEKAVRDNPEPSDVNDYKTYLYAFASSSPYTPTVLLEIAPDVTINGLVVTVEQPSFSGVTLGADGKVYLASESSGIEDSRQVQSGPFTFTVNVTSTRSVFVVDPLSPPNPNTAAPAPFVEHLTAPEGIRFQGAGFPLLIVEEGKLDADIGRLLSADAAGNTTLLCEGFKSLEDVIVDADGVIYVTEDSTGRIIKLAQPPATTETPVPSATPAETLTVTPIPSTTATATVIATATATEMPVGTQNPTTPTATAIASETPDASATPNPADPLILLPLINVNR